MQTANRNITVPPGATALVGRTTLVPVPGGGGGGGGSVPAWASGAVLNKAIAIANTAGFGGSVGAFSGMARKGTTIISGLASGHSAGYENSVTSIDYMLDAPLWVQRIAPSTLTSPDTPYYPDGKPAGRHTYQMGQYVAALDCVVYAGVRFTYPNASTFTNADALDVSGATYTWKTPGYIQNVPGLNGGGVIDYDGIFHAGIFNFRLDPVTRQWASGTVTVAPGYSTYAQIRHPWATDVAGRKVFGLSMGDGEGFETGLRASVMRNNVVYPVTIASSSALTQFIVDFPAYMGMDYDTANSKFMAVDLYNRRLYWVTVADDNTAVMTAYAPDLSGVSLPILQSNEARINPRVFYDATLKGFLIAPYGVDMIFIKTS